MLLAILTAVLIMSAAPWCAAQSKTQSATQNASQNVPQSKEQAVAITDDITPPRQTEVAVPEYTAEAKKKKIEGSVTLEIVVDRKGNVVAAKVVKGLGYGLDENAIIAVREWKYVPAQKDDEPVAVKMEVTVDFYLRD
jgi:TonB family protein